MFIFASTGSKINCKQISTCTWVLDNLLNSLSTLQADYSKRCRGKYTATCTCLSGIPDCYQTSQCGMVLNGLSQIMQPVIGSLTSECSRSNALKWDIHYGVCTFVSNLIPDFLLKFTNHGSTQITRNPSGCINLVDLTVGCLGSGRKQSNTICLEDSNPV